MPTAKLLIPALLVVGLACVASAQKPAEPKKTPLETFMRKKLDASSQILEGLCQEDAELIQKGADQLSEMSKAEVWNVLTDADYREHSREFRDNARRLSEAATAGDFDRAALRWFDVTMSCMDCHDHVRGERKAKK